MVRAVPGDCIEIYISTIYLHHKGNNLGLYKGC